MKRIRVFFTLLVALVPIAGGAAPVDWPTKPVRIIVPFPPGQGADIIARLLSERFSDEFGQRFIVENRPGAGSMLGTAQAAKAPADGYTLLIGGTSAMVINPFLFADAGYDTLRDFAPISNVASLPMVILVRRSLPVSSIGELIQYAKAHPGKLTYGSAGNGSSHHLVMARFARMAGIDIRHVPYKGSAAAMTDLLGDNIDLLSDTLPAVTPNVTAGKVRALAISSRSRSPFMPDLPTLDESGLKGFDVTAWSGLLAPRQTPPEILDRLNAATVKALNQPDVRQRFKELSMSIIGDSRQDFERFIREELERWKVEVKSSGAKVD
ncbi:tripartite tricarboxylate transporter substrate binding protein [Pigmentiphaga sp.]|uniref:Bug family tripartite tricarboxylate transporter substrate binding protein n=1 Tax=Pigmentiphaga sp. TaxID=1977564 RepID=UPI0025F10A3D|nr:tripartite tricarboxylate transporter substrate binding protein [Pigmentiphaga sp.]